MPPLARELTPAPPVPHALRRFADARPALFESVSHPGRLGRFSFLTADTAPLPLTDGPDPFAAVRAVLDRDRREAVPGLPPFQGGAVGLLGYEFGRRFERLPEPKRGPVWEEIGVPPEAAVRLADWALAWDHDGGRAWVVSTGMTPDTPPDVRRAADRLAWALDRLAGPPRATAGPRAVRPWPAAAGSPVGGVEGRGGALSPFTRAAYEAAVAETVELIRAGDLFQANLSQPLLTTFGGSAIELYERLRAANPAPFAGLFPLGDFAVLSASPERFLSVGPTGEVEARPIKGTRRRAASPALDLLVADELRDSAKDRAENVMIVDLLRNDLSRVCEPHSVRVPTLCARESYEAVHHLVSEVRGTLRAGEDCWSLLAAAYPCGSITGAPKVRAMEVIAALEPAARGPYCGSLFWAGRDGSFDANVLIRTVTLHAPTGRAVLPVGGGVTARSAPAAEYAETLHKAAATLRAFGG